MSGRRTFTNARAFTLVELLAVIAIISLLLSILLPTLGNVRGAAQRMPCLNNLRLMGQGINGYAAFNSGYLPPSGVYFLPYQIDWDWSTDPPAPTNVREHRWSPGVFAWSWPDFIQPYFDTEAQPAHQGTDTIARQPVDGNYDRVTLHLGANDPGWVNNPPIKYSHRMDCPSTPNRDCGEYAAGGFKGGSWWQGPECIQHFDYVDDGQGHSVLHQNEKVIHPDVPPPTAGWDTPKFPRMADQKVDRFITIVEPDERSWGTGLGYSFGAGNPPAADVGPSLLALGVDHGGYGGFLRYAWSTPHVNKTTNALYLDGHAVTFSGDYLRGLYSYFYNNGKWDPNDPFHNP